MRNDITFIRCLFPDVGESGLDLLRVDAPRGAVLAAIDSKSCEMVIPVTEKSCESVADGDLYDLIHDLYEELYLIKRKYECVFELHILVGGGHPDVFAVDPTVIAILAIFNFKMFVRSAAAADGQDR